MREGREFRAPWRNQFFSLNVIFGLGFLAKVLAGLVLGDFSVGPGIPKEVFGAINSRISPSPSRASTAG